MARDEASKAGDPFSAFWTDFFQRMTPSSAGTAGSASPPSSSEAAQQFRRLFFDAMAQQADQFMRSEAFLSAMKQSMDNALAWQQMVNQYVQKGVGQFQMPTRADADHVVLLVRGMEERIVKKLEALEKRVNDVEKGESAAAAGPRTAVNRSNGRAGGLADSAGRSRGIDKSKPRARGTQKGARK